MNAAVKSEATVSNKTTVPRNSTVSETANFTQTQKTGQLEMFKAVWRECGQSIKMMERKLEATVTLGPTVPQNAEQLELIKAAHESFEQWLENLIKIPEVTVTDADPTVIQKATVTQAATVPENPWGTNFVLIQSTGQLELVRAAQQRFEQSMEKLAKKLEVTVTQEATVTHVESTVIQKPIVPQAATVSNKTTVIQKATAPQVDPTVPQSGSNSTPFLARVLSGSTVPNKPTVPRVTSGSMPATVPQLDPTVPQDAATVIHMDSTVPHANPTVLNKATVPHATKRSYPTTVTQKTTKSNAALTVPHANPIVPNKPTVPQVTSGFMPATVPRVDTTVPQMTSGSKLAIVLQLDPTVPHATKRNYATTVTHVDSTGPLEPPKTARLSNLATVTRNLVNSVFTVTGAPATKTPRPFSVDQKVEKVPPRVFIPVMARKLEEEPKIVESQSSEFSGNSESEEPEIPEIEIPKHLLQIGQDFDMVIAMIVANHEKFLKKTPIDLDDIQHFEVAKTIGNDRIDVWNAYAPILQNEMGNSMLYTMGIPSFSQFKSNDQSILFKTYGFLIYFLKSIRDITPQGMFFSNGLFIDLEFLKLIYGDLADEMIQFSEDFRDLELDETDLAVFIVASFYQDLIPEFQKLTGFVGTKNLMGVCALYTNIMEYRMVGRGVEMLVKVQKLKEQLRAIHITHSKKVFITDIKEHVRLPEFLKEYMWLDGFQPTN